jgi:hypothetical protein
VLLIFGTRAFETLLLVVSFVCPHCGVDARQSVYKSATRFTLFFIPLFTVSTRYFVHCSNCGVATSLTRQQAEHSLEWASSQRAASA